MLRPTMILKRKTPYTLQCKNDIDLLITNSDNGWMNSEILIEWFNKILIPYVGKNHCLLLYDSYEAHISNAIFNFLKDYTNIHIGVIVGGTTNTDQPLDIKVNKVFKDYCRSRAIRFTNHMLTALHKSGEASKKEKEENTNIVQGNFLFDLN